MNFSIWSVFAHMFLLLYIWWSVSCYKYSFGQILGQKIFVGLDKTERGGGELLARSVNFFATKQSMKVLETGNQPTDSRFIDTFMNFAPGPSLQTTSNLTTKTLIWISDRWMLRIKMRWVADDPDLLQTIIPAPLWQKCCLVLASELLSQEWPTDFGPLWLGEWVTRFGTSKWISY